MWWHEPITLVSRVGHTALRHCPANGRQNYWNDSEGQASNPFIAGPEPGFIARANDFATPIAAEQVTSRNSMAALGA